MSDVLDKCLDDLQARIDERQERENLSAWVAFWEDRCEEEFFVPPARKPAPPRVAWLAMKVNDALADLDSMLLHQFKGCSDVLAAGGNRRLTVRCNYGTGILPTLFGCELFMMDRELDTLPTARPLGSREKIEALLGAGVPDIRGGLGGRVLAAGERFLEVFQARPVLARNVALYHPDVQGPIDIAEVVWGSDIFYAFYDDPDFLRGFLALITDTYAAFMREWYALTGAADRMGGLSAHWNIVHKGRLMIRNDSLMNLSPQVYVDFVRPLDQRLFDEFGGGAVHFCGRADHYIEPMSRMRGLTAVNLSQPHLNDMDAIYRNTVDKDIRLLDLTRKAAETANRPLRGRVQCF